MVDDEALRARAALRRARRAERRRQIRRRRLGALTLLVLAVAVPLAVARGGGGANDAAGEPRRAAGDGRGGGAKEAPAVSGPRTGRDGGEEAPAPAPPPTGSVRIAAVGDTMLGATPQVAPDPEHYFDAARSALRGDIVFGNLEGTLTDQTASKCGATSSGCFAFRAPPSYADALAAAGFTIMSLSNNHAFDYWQAGLDDTVAALDAAGLAHTGRTSEIAVLHVDDLDVAFVGFASYPNTGPLNDPAAARRLIRRAGRRADLVVVTMHAGAEGTDAAHVTGASEFYFGENRGNPREFARRAVDWGADLVIGHGPHVLRGMEVYRGRLIAYSLGNFAGYHNFSLSGALAVSAVLQVRLDARGRFTRGKLVPLALVEPGRPVPDPARTALAAVEALSRDDFGASAVRVLPDGRLRAPR